VLTVESFCGVRPCPVRAVSTRRKPSGVARPEHEKSYFKGFEGCWRARGSLKKVVRKRAGAYTNRRRASGRRKNGDQKAALRA
jgi:hypothetical protein